MKPTVYIAGRMRGIEVHNFPAFYNVADGWRNQGWEVINPAELDAEGLSYAENIAKHAECKDFCLVDDMTFADYMRRDLHHLINRAHALAMIKGWEDSEGAVVEHTVAKALSLFILDAGHPIPPPPTHPFVANVCCTKPDYGHLVLRGNEQ